MPMPFVSNLVNGKIDSKSVNKSNIFSQLIHHFMYGKAKTVYKRIETFISQSDRILDIGIGAATLASYLLNNGYHIEGVDVVNLSLYSDMQPKIYDGKKLPYEDDTFDVALLITVLHHSGIHGENKEVLKEAMRVAKRVIVIEDSYRNRLERKVVSIIDQISNWEFWEHDYLTNDEWFKFFNKNNWNTVFATQYDEFPFGITYSHYCLYVLEKRSC